jgi:hypothetical protein
MILKLSVEDARGQKAVLLSEFHNRRGNLDPKPSQSDCLFWMHYDDVVEFNRRQITVSKLVVLVLAQKGVSLSSSHSHVQLTFTCLILTFFCLLSALLFAVGKERRHRMASRCAFES